MRHFFAIVSLLGCLFILPMTHADVSLPAIFGDHMVLQRDLENRVWGWAEPGEKVTVTIADQEHSATADDKGNWEVKLAKLPAGGPHKLKIEGKNSRTISDLMVGEVWLCSGQSNMEWPVEQAYDGDLEKMIADNPNIRLITVPHVGTQEPQKDFKGEWQQASAQSVKEFSAVGYYFGKQLQETLDVPVGLVDISWGGSACEAWIERSLLAGDERFKPLHDYWVEFEKTYDFQKKKTEWQEQVKKWEDGGKQGPAPWEPWDELKWRNRPANIYNGVLKPILGYGMRGAIWYQGETNAGRAHQYQELFPFMISSWRNDWQIGDFPFYWVQLADFTREVSEPGDSDWAELREAQTLTLDKLPNTGQAVIIDIGEADDIHPRNKRDVALRLARIALAQDYGIKVPYTSPRYKSMTVEGNKIVVTFETGEHAEGALKAFDKNELMGFTIAGEDKKFVPAQAKIIGNNQVEVWSDAVAKPVAVRYAWANNPVCNLENRAGLPASPFRTDKWPGITEGNLAPQIN
jgi:sialate O-acetylesterase